MVPPFQFSPEALLDITNGGKITFVLDIPTKFMTVNTRGIDTERGQEKLGPMTQFE